MSRTLHANFSPNLADDLKIKRDLRMNEREKRLFAAHENLKMQLRLKGTSLAAIARSLDVSRTTMSLVGLRKLSVPRIEKEIAKTLNKPISELFEPIQKEETE